MRSNSSSEREDVTLQLLLLLTLVLVASPLRLAEASTTESQMRQRRRRRLCVIIAVVVVASLPLLPAVAGRDPHILASDSGKHGARRSVKRPLMLLSCRRTTEEESAQRFGKEGCAQIARKRKCSRGGGGESTKGKWKEVHSRLSFFF